MSDHDKQLFAEAESIDEVLHLLVGAASVCWSEPPTGTFDSERALQVAARARDRVALLLLEATAF